MITVIGDLIADILVSKGDTNYATDTEGSIQIRSGGQANNVASWIRHEGVKSRLIGRIGADPFGTFLLDEAKNRGIDCSTVAIDPYEQTGKIVILIDDRTGERSMITDRGANLRLAAEDLHGMENSQFLYLSGYTFFVPEMRQVIHQAKQMAQTHGIPIAFDPSSTYYLQQYKDELLDFLPGITYLTPNYEEGVLLTEKEDPHQILTVLKEYVSHPILKLGEDGCALFLDDEFIQLPAKKVNAIDSTGAGDAFIGTLLATVGKTNDLLGAAKRAVAVSSEVVTRVGAIPSLKM